MSALVASDEGQSPAPQAQLQKSMEANGALAKKEAVKSVRGVAREERCQERMDWLVWSWMFMAACCLLVGGSRLFMLPRCPR